MARRGSFTGATEYFGAPLALIHPLDNDFPQFDPEIEDLEGLTEEQRREYQQEVDELLGALILGRDFRE